MSSNLDELARMLVRDDELSFAIGTVISTNPYRIRYGPKVILDKDKLRFNSGLIHGYKGTYDGRTIWVYDNLQTGDEVAMIPNEGKWHVLCKVVKA